MILPDANIVVHAYNPGSPYHAKARTWFVDELSSRRTVGFAWITIVAYVRLVTSTRAVANPITVSAAESDVRSWLARRNVTVVHPTERHADLLFEMLRVAGAAGNLTTDAHLAALSIEHAAEVATADADFARFPRVRWKNPLV